MVTLHEVITFLVSMQISISSLQTHNVNRCGRSRHLARKLSLDRKSGSAGMPRPISYAVFCLKKKKDLRGNILLGQEIKYLEHKQDKHGYSHSHNTNKDTRVGT